MVLETCDCRDLVTPLVEAELQTDEVGTRVELDRVERRLGEWCA
jgi:hypothetical protein